MSSLGKPSDKKGRHGLRNLVQTRRGRRIGQHRAGGRHDGFLDQPACQIGCHRSEVSVGGACPIDSGELRRQLGVRLANSVLGAGG